MNGWLTALANRQTEGAGATGCQARWRPGPSEGEEGPGRNEGTGSRGAGHRRRETPVPASGEEVGEKGHHYDRIIAFYLETVTGPGHLFIHLRCMLTVHSCDISRMRKSTRNRRPSADQCPN